MKQHPNPYHWTHGARHFMEKRIEMRAARVPSQSISADSRILTMDDLYSFGDGQGLPISLADEAFALPANYQELVDAAFFNMEKLGMIQYATQRWDCENFARMAREWMNAFHLRTGGALDAGLAVAMVIYQPDGAQNLHAINCGFRRNDTGLYIEYSEPQSGRIVNLSKSELESRMGAEL